MTRSFRIQMSVVVLQAAWVLALVSPATAASPAPAIFEEDGADFVRMGQTAFWWKGLVKVYDIALHMGQGTDASKVLTDVPMRLELMYHRGITAADIIKGGDGLLRRNVDAAMMKQLEARLGELNRAYVDVKQGDIYALTYVPGNGTTLRLNGKALVTIPGHDFAAAYFRIWLGSQPMNAQLREKLLGR
jgi:hypothetical protein